MTIGAPYLQKKKPKFYNLFDGKALLLQLLFTLQSLL